MCFCAYPHCRRGHQHMEDGDFISLSERMSHLNPNQSTPIMLEPRGANATGNTEQALVRSLLDAYQQSTIHVSLQADAAVNENDNLKGAYTVLYPSTTETVISENKEILALPLGSGNAAELSAIVVRLAHKNILVKQRYAHYLPFIRTISLQKKANHFCRSHHFSARPPCLA